MMMKWSSSRPVPCRHLVSCRLLVSCLLCILPGIRYIRIYTSQAEREREREREREIWTPSSPPLHIPYRYGKSPYIYPLYGLGGLPEGFSRLCAIHGGTFMLNKAVDEVLMDDQGKAWAIKTGNEVAKAPLVIGEPSYFPAEKSRVVGQVREGASPLSSSSRSTLCDKIRYAPASIDFTHCHPPTPPSSSTHPSI